MLFFGWWWAWLLFMIVLVALPAGYGWGYRGWGPPYPRDPRVRRGGAMLSPPPDEASDVGWGMAAVWLWIAFFLGVVWLLAGLAWWW